MDFLITILFAVMQIIGTILFTYYGWVIVVAIFLYLIWQNRRREQWVGQIEHILLQIEVPKENEKKELSAEQMFASLHGILRSKSDLRKEGSLQEHISFEIAVINDQIRFYVWTPRHLKNFVEGQIYAQYPNVQITEGIADYAKTELGSRQAYTTVLGLTKTELLPIKTFQSFEVDPLAGITATLANMEDPGEEMWIQILARPIDDDWHSKGLNYIEDIKEGKTHEPFEQMIFKALLAIPGYILTNFLGALVTPPGEAKEVKKELKATTGDQALAKAAEEKISKLGYQVYIRIVYLGNDPIVARQRNQAIIGGFKQFNTTNLNGFYAESSKEGTGGVDAYRARLFTSSGYILNIEELASVYHLPHKSVETPNMVWTTTKTSEPPPNLPTELTAEPTGISLFAATNFRGKQLKFGMKRIDRGRHLYIIGQTGTGKSKLLNLLSLSDIYHGEGMAIIDPHGDFATDMLQYVPEHRLQDVIYFNPTDRDFPIAFNPLEVYDQAFKNDISSEMIGVLKRMFESWGPRLEYILRFTLLALLDYPDATMLGITRMLTDKEFRKKVIKEIKDPVVKAFWVTEFASWNDKFANEAVAPVLNKVGAFTANPLIRNIIGQPRSRLDLRKIMDEGKILVVNLSRGQIGEDNASILGALMVTKIQLAAMSRANIPLDQRRPFYLYVDEFQNFATDSFATILSEARKYALNLTVANQYVSQMPEEVRSAVFGNVGSIVSFRVGVDDAPIIAKNFAPLFEPDDLGKLHNQHILIDMSIDGEKSMPFSAKTLRMPDPEYDFTPQLIELSRQHYASDRTQVEQEISEWTLGQAATEKPSAEQEATPAPTPHEQKPNSFLGALKNPEPPPASQPVHAAAHNPGSTGGNRNKRRGRSGQRNQNEQMGNRSGQQASVGAGTPVRMETRAHERAVRPEESVVMRGPAGE
ncbi:MAG TPA: DUF87 domain-containing protein [Candidatus Saccharimonadia bacterium]